MEAFTFFTPVRIHFGMHGWRAALHAERELLQGNVLVVSTGRSLTRLGYLPALLEELRTLRGGQACLLYDQISANPRLREVEEAVSIGRTAQVNTVIGFGGGSAIDAAKAVAAGLGASCSVEEMLLQEIAPTTSTPRIIAIPTTAGTGSELSKGAIISSPEHHIKTGIRGEHIYPTVAIVDSSFTWQIPRRTTVETGFDVLAHAVESLISKKATPLSRQLSVTCIELVGQNLPRLLVQPQDAGARDAMSYASMLMGFNLGNVGTALPHRLQYPIGAATDTSHGAGLMALYPGWLSYEYDYAPALVEQAMTALVGQPCQGKAACLEALQSFLTQLGERRTLQELGLRPEDVPVLAKQVTGNIANDPAAAEPDIMVKLYEAAMR